MYNLSSRHYVIWLVQDPLFRKLPSQLSYEFETCSFQPVIYANGLLRPFQPKVVSFGSLVETVAQPLEQTLTLTDSVETK